MSDTIWLEVGEGREKSGGERDDSIMLELTSELDALAERLGVPKLSSFCEATRLRFATRVILRDATGRMRFSTSFSTATPH